jgi:acyl dehydratase
MTTPKTQMTAYNQTHTSADLTEQEEEIESHVDVLASYLASKGLQFHIMVRVPETLTALVTTNTKSDDKETRRIWAVSLAHTQAYDEQDET